MNVRSFLLAALLAASTRGANADFSIRVGEGVNPGETLLLSIGSPAGVSNTAGLDVRFVVDSPPGAPPLSPAFAAGKQSIAWQTLTSSAQPWRFTTFSFLGVAGPAELARLRLRVSPLATVGTAYTLRTDFATLADSQGKETDAATLLEIRRVAPDPSGGRIGSANVVPGETVTIPVVLGSAGSSIAGCDLTLRVTAPSGQPTPAIQFSTGMGSAGWQTVSSPSQPLRFALLNATPVAGPAELARVTLSIPPGVSLGGMYVIEATSATLVDEKGVETNLTGKIEPGELVARPIPGDFDRNGNTTAIELRQSLQFFLGIATPSAAQLAALDTLPIPGVGRSYGDGRIGSDDLNRVLRVFLGLDPMG